MTDQISKLELATEKIDLTKSFRTIPTKSSYELNLETLHDLRKMCLKVWLEQGILRLATEEIEKLGYRNRSGKPYSSMSVRKYALDFVIFYPSEARKLYQAVGEFLENDQFDIQWMWHLINIAVRQLKSKQNFIRWTVKQGLYKKAFHLFKDLYNLTDADYNAYDDLLGDDK